MKKVLFTVGILMCMFLMACKNEQQSPVVDENHVADIELDVEKYPGESVVTLYENAGINLILQSSVSPDTNRICYVLKAMNDIDQKLSITVKNWVVNHSLVIEESCVFYMEPISEMTDLLEEMTSAVHMENQMDIYSVQCQIEVRDENYELLDEAQVSIDLETPLVPAIIYDIFMDARAEAQVLLENENVRITLDGWGKSPDSNYVRGVLHFENLSETRIPVVVNGIAINDIFMEISDTLNYLDSGESCYTTCSLLSTQLADEGISSISKVSFMILTDESQNTGSVTYGGGVWYPVTLAEKGDMSAVFETGELLDGTQEVQISFLGREQDAWDSGGGVYKWKLAIENNSDENIEIAILDVLLDGISEDEWCAEDLDRSVYVANNEVGAHSNRYIFISTAYGEDTTRPELSFKIQIRSMAGGSVIYTGEDMITISPEE